MQVGRVDRAHLGGRVNISWERQPWNTPALTINGSTEVAHGDHLPLARMKWKVVSDLSAQEKLDMGVTNTTEAKVRFVVSHNTIIYASAVPS
jgi:hypothetical protein